MSWGNESEQNPLERYINDPDDPMLHYLWKGKQATGFKVGTKVIGLIRHPETVIDAMEVIEIFSNNFSDRDFPGYANVTITWSQLHQIL